MRERERVYPASRSLPFAFRLVSSSRTSRTNNWKSAQKRGPAQVGNGTVERCGTAGSGTRGTAEVARTETDSEAKRTKGDECWAISGKREIEACKRLTGDVMTPTHTHTHTNTHLRSPARTHTHARVACVYNKITLIREQASWVIVRREREGEG